MKRIQRTAAALAVVLLVLAWALLAHARVAPVAATPAAANIPVAAHVAKSTPSAVRAVATRAAAVAPRDPSTPTPTPTLTTVPTPTPSPSPTPSPTVTPAPRWHTVGTYSGSSPQSLPNFTATDWRITWTCTPGTPVWYMGLAWANGHDQGGLGSQCVTGNDSGIWTCASVAGSQCGGDDAWNLSVGGQGSDAWTVTLEAYY